MKKISIMILFILSHFYIDSEETYKRTIIQENHEHFGILAYFDDYYNNEILTKTELVFTEQYINKAGRLKQIDFYDFEGQPIKYDAFFNDKYTDYWGVKRTTEYLTNNQYDKVEYTFYNDSIYKFDKNHLDKINNYPIILLNTIRSQYKENNEKETFIIPDVERFTSCIKIIDTPGSKASIEEIAIIKDWLAEIRSGDISMLFKNKISVIEKDFKYDFFINEKIIDSLNTYEECLVYGIYIGDLNGIPITLVFDYNDMKI